MDTITPGEMLELREKIWNAIKDNGPLQLAGAGVDMIEPKADFEFDIGGRHVTVHIAVTNATYPKRPC